MQVTTPSTQVCAPLIDRQRGGRAKSLLRSALLGLLTTAFAVCGATAQPQASDYPNKPIKFVLPFPAASAADSVARFIGQTITEQTGQAVIIENRAGANGFIAAQAVATAPPDGYTVFITSNTTHAANAALFKKLPYDPIKDFAPVTLILKGGGVMVVAADSPIKSIPDLITRARAQPGKLTFASGNSSTRIASEMFVLMTGTKIVHVPYKGVPPALNDLMGKQFDFMIADLVSAQPLIQQGKLRALGVTTPKRHPGLKDVPTIAEAGLAGFELEAWSACFVPAGTPRPVIDKLHRLILTGLASKAGRDYFERTGLTASPSTPEELGAFVRSETEKWAKVVKAAGIEPE